MYNKSAPTLTHTHTPTRCMYNNTNASQVVCVIDSKNQSEYPYLPDYHMDISIFSYMYTLFLAFGCYSILNPASARFLAVKTIFNLAKFTITGYGFFKIGDRIGGYYTHLSMWGIYSVKLFCEKNYNILTNLTGIRDSILSIRPGFPKQPKDKIVGKNLLNEITCGDYNKGKSLRFNKNILVTKSSNVVIASRNSTNLKKSIQLTHVKSDVDSDIDKSIYELISIEFTDCPKKSLFGTFGCIKLSCVYNGRYVIIRPYLHKTDGSTMYEISFYDTSNDEKKGLVETKEVKIDSKLKNILEYEKMLVFLFNYDSGTSLTSIVTNFNISSVVNILMNTTIPRVIQILKTSTDAKIEVPDYIYSM